MKTFKKVFIGTGIFCAFIVITVIALAIISGIPTTGKKIEKYPEPRKALMVIDIQEDFTGTTAGPSSPYKNDMNAISSVNDLIRKASEKNIQVVYVRQEFEGLFIRTIIKLFMNGVALKGSPGSAIDKRIEVVSGNIFSKSKGDAFSNPELDAFMIKNRINELYITGLDAEYCVYTTAKGALNRGYKVNIITDAIFLGAKNNWDSVINKYRKDGINLITAKDFR